MGFFEKIKGLFYDEEEIDVPIDEVKEDVTIKSGNIALMERDSSVQILNDTKKENSQLKINEFEANNEINQVVSERDLMSTTQNFKFPIIFEDEDIAKIEKKEEVSKTEEVLEIKTEEKYQKPVLDRKVIDEVVKKPKKFQPTPIISPIYGILDKNYDKSSINKNNSGESNIRNKEMELNFDTIRQKAYGTLTDDIEKELTRSETAIDEIESKIDNILEENNLLGDLQYSNQNDENLYNYEDFGVEYKIDESNKDNLKAQKDKEVELTEDLFNLIESMYDK